MRLRLERRKDFLVSAIVDLLDGLCLEPVDQARLHRLTQEV